MNTNKGCYSYRIKQKAGILLLLILIVFCYAISDAGGKSSVIKIESPTEQDMITEGVIELRGCIQAGPTLRSEKRSRESSLNVDREEMKQAQLLVNGVKVTVESDGSFRTLLKLIRGQNTFQLEAYSGERSIEKRTFRLTRRESNVPPSAPTVLEIEAAMVTAVFSEELTAFVAMKNNAPVIVRGTSSATRSSVDFAETDDSVPFSGTKQSAKSGLPQVGIHPFGKSQDVQIAASVPTAVGSGLAMTGEEGMTLMSMGGGGSGSSPGYETVIEVVQGWNMVSVPRIQSNYDANVVFPNKNGAVYAYDTQTGYYVAAPVVSNGQGYWMNHSTTTITISGPEPGPVSTTAAKAGWMLIGSRATQAQVSELQLSDGAIIYGTAFRYDAQLGYNVPTSVINPGDGIWIYVDKACTVTIPPPKMAVFPIEIPKITSEISYYNSQDGNGGVFNPTDPNFVEATTFTNGNLIKNWSFESEESDNQLSDWIIGAQISLEYDRYVGSQAVKIYKPDTNWTAVYQQIGILDSAKTYTASVWFKAASGVNGQIFFGDAWGDYDNCKVTAMPGNGSWQRLSVTHTMTHDDTMGVFIYGVDIYTDVLYDGMLVEEASQASDPMVSTAYTDGNGRTIQTQVRNSTVDLVTVATYDSAGRADKQWRSRSYNTYHRYDPNAVGLMEGYYEGDCAYAQAEFERSPLFRIFKQKPLGALTSENEHITYSYGSATIDGQECIYVQTRSKANSSEPWVITRKFTDKLGRLIKTASYEEGQAEEIVSRTYYTMLGLPYRIVDPRGLESTMEYDYIGRVVKKKTPDGGTSRFAYDKAGRLRFMADSVALATGKVLYWKYDILGRVTEKGYIDSAWSDGSKWRSYADSYPAYPVATPASWRKQFTYGMPMSPSSGTSAGKLIKAVTNNDDASDVEVEELFVYDYDGNVTAKGLRVYEYDYYSRSTRYEYDFIGKTKQVVYPSSGNEIVTYGYDRLGRMLSVGDGTINNAYADYLYNTEGKLDGEILNHNGSMIKYYNYDYDYRGRIWSVNGNGAMIQSFSYANMYNGSIASTTFDYTWMTGKTDSTKNNTYGFSYDKYGRLTVADNSEYNPLDIGVGNPTTYDYNSNIYTMRRGGVDKTYNKYSNTNQVQNTDGSGSDYVYDQNGNMITASARSTPVSLTYDVFTNMTSKITETSSGYYQKYQYDARNVRVLKTDYNGTTTKMVYLHGLNDYPLVEKTSTTERIYIYGSTGLIVIKEGTSKRYVQKDHLGSTRVLYDESGEAVTVYEYDANGKCLGRMENTQVMYKFTGQEYESESDLHNFRARMYDDDLVGFYAVDPAGQTHSPYSYCLGNPIMFVDPTGRLGRMKYYLDGVEMLDSEVSYWIEKISGLPVLNKLPKEISQAIKDGKKVATSGNKYYVENTLTYTSGELGGDVYSYDKKNDNIYVENPGTWNITGVYKRTWWESSVVPANPQYYDFAKKYFGDYDVFRAVDKINSMAQSDYTGWCARHVRTALQAGNLNMDDRPNAAKDYDTYLLKKGFKNFTPKIYSPITGDVIVMEATTGKNKHEYGHIQMYNGDKWVSDTKQKSFWPYILSRPEFTILRHVR